MLKNSLTRNLQKLDRVRKLYKRFSPVSWTFSITRFSTFFRKTDFFNISNEVGRVKRDLIFFLVRACTPHPLAQWRLVLRIVPCLANPLARPVLLINSVLPTKHLSDHVRP
jgi:hypothetical protein